MSNSQANCHPAYFGENESLFGWIHINSEGAHRTPVVICSPSGFELVRAHKSVRVLADQLARAGHATLRFDYSSCGDSFDHSSKQDDVDAWLTSTMQAINYLNSVTGTSSIILAGIRIGANIAAMVAEQTPIEQLVLWEPLESGKAFCREMQIIASASKYQSASGIEAGGFLISPESQESLSKIELGRTVLQNKPPILYLERNDIPSKKRRRSALEKTGSVIHRETAPGYREMMLAPQESSVPLEAINKIVRWLKDHPSGSEASSHYTLNLDNVHSTSKISNGIFERAVKFGPNQRLFGILTSGTDALELGLPTVITLCGGAVPHYSANRVYVPFARRLAARGYNVLRMDLSGIADSRRSPGGPRDTAYTATSSDDIQSAIDLVTKLRGDTQISLLGFCSGAYAAMKFAETSGIPNELLLINQLVYFVTDDELEKLAAGEISSAIDLDFPRSRDAFSRALRKLLRSLGGSGAWLGKLMQRQLVGGDLNRLLEALASQNMYTTFIHAEEDPSHDALLLAARGTVSRLTKSERASLFTIPHADHTFSSSESQASLINFVEQVLGDRRRHALK